MAAAQTYQPVDSLSSIKFSIRNFGINTEGVLKGLHGSILFDPANPASSSFSVVVDPASVNTKVNARDNHLRKEEYLDVQQYPKISFISDKVNAVPGTGEYSMHGTLTIKGVSKDLIILFKAITEKEGIWFTGTCKLNRRDFKVGSGSMVLADNLAVNLHVFARKLDHSNR
jgi:polyisoprenoid-binding protein YceI